MTTLGWDNVDLPEHLFHYTDAGGLIGILGRDAITLRASSVIYLNDVAELEFSGRLLAAHIVTAADALSENDAALSRSLTDIANVIELELRSVKVYQSEGFVCCFSSSKDSLTQWQGYGGGESYALRFDPQVLQDLEPVKTEWEDNALPYLPTVETEMRPILYGNTEKCRELFDNVVKKIIDRLQKSPGGAQVDYFEAMYADAMPILPWIKHDGFSHEREWRILATGNHELVKHRLGRHSITPFLEVPLPKRALTGVIVGPGRNTKLRCSGVQSLLYRNGYRLPITGGVWPSKIPYRG